MDGAPDPTSGLQEGGHYQIRIQGHLDARWADRFEGMRFSHERDGTTILSGKVADQAALHGLLSSVRDLGLSLISVIRMGRVRSVPPAVTPDTEGDRPLGQSSA